MICDVSKNCNICAEMSESFLICFEISPSFLKCIDELNGKKFHVVFMKKNSGTIVKSKFHKNG